jgi:prefoldin subunit 5
MRKVIGILVIILFLLSIGALILGNSLFGKRELLKGRTQALETAVNKIGKVIEAEAPVAPEANADDFPQKDISPCKAEPLDKPEFSNFWQKYKRELEAVDLPLINMETNRMSLMNLYRRDPVTGEIMKDPATGYPIKNGEGTMASVLDDFLIKKASEQLDRLNDTRQMLKDTRVELTDTIREVNKLKPELRGKLKDIEDLKTQAEGLKKDIKTRDETIDGLKIEKKDLEDKANQAKADMAKMQEVIDEKDTTIKQLEKKLSTVNTPVVGTSTPSPDGGPALPPWKPSLGQKGKVLQVNPEWNFIIVELSDEFIAESEAAGRPDPAGIELFVKRLGKTEQLVSKIRLSQVKKAQKLAIGDNLSSWQQMPIKEGDVLFF